MASGGFEFGASGSLQGKIDWSSSSNGSIANSSNVTAILYARRIDGYTTWGQDWRGYVNVGGAQTNISFSGSVSVGSEWVEMARVTTTVPHNSDGTGSVTISGSVTGPTETSLEYRTSSGSQGVTLDRIPRASTINSFTGDNIEGNFNVTYTSYSNFTNKLRISIPNVTELQTINNYTSGANFTLNSSSLNYLYSYMSETNSVTLGAVIETWSGSTKIGESSELTVTAKITNANPTFNNFTYQDTNSSVVNVTGTNQVLVKGLSTLRAIISSANKMVAQKGATPKNYVSTLDNINVSTNYSDSSLNIDLGTVSSSGTKRLNVRAYDSRNNSTLVYKDIPVYDYEKPVIHYEITRLNNFENQTTLKVSGTYSRLTINNTDKNTVTTVRYRYKEAGGSFTAWRTLTATVNEGNFTCSDVILSLDNTKQFVFEIEAIDRLQTSTESYTLDIGQAIFFISSNKRACYINGQEILTYDVVDTW